MNQHKRYMKMTTKREWQHKEFYKALLEKNPEYEGTFFVGVKTTGVFCRPTCPARKPKSENCEFFRSAEEALIASYRPCLRCQPLSPPNSLPKDIQALIAAIEKNPEKRWKDWDLKAFSLDPSTVRRQFKARFGMTFVQYARAKRMGIALKDIHSGKSVIDAQLDTGFESSSGFRDAFTKIMGAAPFKKGAHQMFLQAAWIDTPLGPMVGISDENALYLLEFINRRALETEIRNLREKLGASVVPGETAPLTSIKKELELYFQETLTQFKTPIHLFGTPFQQTVWKALLKIPYGKTIGYAELAKRIGRPKAFRAVANANGKNQLAIIIPCHRVINTNGDLGGYGGGLQRKKWLLDHEREGVKTAL